MSKSKNDSVTMTDFGRGSMASRQDSKAVLTQCESGQDVTAEGDKDPYFRYKMTKQLCLVGVWICMGLCGEMSGPTLPDLKDRVGVDYEEISQALVGKSVGLMIGSILGGFLHEIFYRHSDLINSLSLMLMAGAAALTPWSSALWMAGFSFLLNGFGEGVINTGGNTMVMHLWRDKAASPMHSLHFGFGFGALLAPQIARPFLAPEPQNTTNSTTESPEYIDDPSRIEVPYSIVAVLIFVFSLVILGFYIKGPPKGFPVRQSSKNLTHMASPGSCTSGHVTFGVAMFACLFFYFIQAVGGERAYGKFLFSFAYETDLMDKDTASVLQSVFWLSFTTARLLGVPLAKFLPLNIIIVGDICLAIFSAVMLAIFAADDVTFLWTFTVCIGLAIAIAFPNGMSWANLHLQMNSVGVMVLMVGGSCGGFVYQYLTGYLFENEGPETLMYVIVGYACLLGVAYVAMTVVSNVMNPNKNVYDFDDFELKIDSDLNQVDKF